MIEITIGILGLLIAWFTYKKTFLDKPKEEIEHLIIQFRSTQATSMKVRNDLISISKKHSLGSSELFPGISIDAYVRLMDESYQKNLSDDRLSKTIELNPSKPILESMINSLERQHTELINMETIIYVHFGKL